jgi:hypothetical protein
VRLDELCVGIRMSDNRLDGILAAVLRDSLVPDVEAPANLSVLFGEDHASAHAYHFLYRGGVRVARAASVGRLLRATISHLEAFVDPRPGTTRFNTKIVCHARGVVLIDPFFGYAFDALERRLGRRGLHIVDAPYAVVDRSTLDVVIEAPRFTLTADALAEINRSFPAPVPEEPVERGPRSLLAVVIPDFIDDEDPSPARRFSRLTPLAADAQGRLASADLDTLVHLTRTHSVHNVSPAMPEGELLKLLVDITS